MSDPNRNAKIRQQLAGNIRTYMAENQMTGRGLAQLTRGPVKAKGGGVAQSTIVNILNETNLPSLESVADIARALGVPAWQLLVPGRASCTDVSASKLNKMIAAYLRGGSSFRAVMDKLADTVDM